MSRIIINYSDDISTESVPLYVKAVIDRGRISKEGACFCYVNIFKDDTICISKITQAGTDVFTLYRNKEQGE